MSAKAKLSEEQLEKREKRTRSITETYAWNVLIGFVATIVLRIISLKNLDYIGKDMFAPGVHYFTYANLMHFACFMMLVSVVTLMARQNFIYMPYISKMRRKSLDERQMDIRRKAIETSYSVLFLGLIATLWTEAYKLILNKHTFVAQGDITYPVLAVLLLVFALPSVLAAFDKNN